MKLQYLFFLLSVAMFSSCSDEFINHKLAFEKVGDCENMQTPIKMTSNIAGERYEFTECIDADFDGKNFSVNRVGDSIVVSFPNSSDTKASFKLTLDIDAKPLYRHMILDGREVLVGRSE